MNGNAWSKKDLNILKTHWCTTPDPEAIASRLGRSYGVCKSKALKMGLKRAFKSNDPWHEKWKLKKLKALYPDTTNLEIANILGVTEGAVGAKAHLLGLKKTPEFMRIHSANGFFKKGSVPANKGKKQSEYMSAQAIAKTAGTRFKKGHMPHNAKKKDGVIAIRQRHPNRNERPSKWIRLSLGKWQELSRYKWEKKYGKIKRGMVIRFRDGNPLNCTLKNMELISRAENVIRNSSSIHLKDGFIANTLARKKGGIGLYDREARDAYLEDKELIELKRAQLLLQRTIKNKSDVKVKRKRNNNRSAAAFVRPNRKAQ